MGLWDKIKDTFTDIGHEVSDWIPREVKSYIPSAVSTVANVVLPGAGVTLGPLTGKLLGDDYVGAGLQAGFTSFLSPGTWNAITGGGANSISEAISNMFGGSSWTKGTTPTGIPYWFDSSGNVRWTKPSNNLFSLFGNMPDINKSISGLENLLGGYPTGVSGGGNMSIYGNPYGVKYGTPKSAQDLYQQALDFWQNNYPNILKAKEKAIEELANFGPDFFSKYDIIKPTPITSDYFDQFTPTSFDEALTSRYFADVYPEAKKEALHILSKTGMADPYRAATTMGKLRGDIGVNIGEYLANKAYNQAVQGIQRERDLMNLGQARATLGLDTIYKRLGIDPTMLINPYVATDINQSNLSLDTDYQNALTQAAEKSAKTGLVSNLIGGLGGYVLGGDVTSALQGAALGGTISPLFGGDAGFDLGTYLALSRLFDSDGDNEEEVLSVFK